MSREYGMAFEHRVASFKLLFSNGQASHTDVRPDGYGYLDLILRGPWPPGMRKAQWELVKFLIVGAPQSVLRNPRLLHHCARWIGEGPHMDMLATLFSFGLDPEYFDSSLFIAWPRSCDPGWLAEDLAPDPMFIDFLRVCLQRQPGFAGCDDLTEVVLTGAYSEFESALRRAKGEAGVLRTCPNALGQTATHLAITSPRRLERLLQAGADADCVDRRGLTPLMYAAAYGEEQSVLHLVRHQATWHLQERLYGRIFLDYAISRRNLHVVESFVDWLREAGDHDTASEVLDHCIAKSIVQYNDHYDTAIPHRLFELGADPDTVVNSRTLLHYANTPMMSQLIMKFKFKSFLIRDDAGMSPFMQVAHLVDAKSLATLALQNEVSDFNEQDMNGQTALHHLVASFHASQIYDSLGTDRSWQFARHRDMVSCLNTLLQHGASISTTDNCVCACSMKGCTPLTFALHRLSQSFHIDCGIIIDLLQAARRQISLVDASKWCDAIRRYHTFEEQGLTHTCCGARAKDAASACYKLRPGTLEVARNEQIRLMAELHSNSCKESCIDDDIFFSLAALCSMYEQRSIAKNESGIAHRRRKSLLQVDYAQDEIKFCFDFESQSPIRKVTTNCYKDWLRWCDRKFIELDIKGGRRDYTVHGWRLVSMFEDKLDELRSGTEVWYTAPERPAGIP
ncbi:hypothetical protein KC360_g6771 [Hortaea werneckii]|uniref:Uncharacterized protein n=1 Tax=Hortaea werneckii TaxID=91943 RepID=A0A3M7FFV1_HORWE|nr:hypothetical protein KC325_g6660 [Hortaea werneckii]KAI6989316.1 hypothetical protein KC359_g7277 [Hortaea werneckii]KAI7143000.1 hypothetical protein KC344_g6681 [Hortaea werneckii]KAI7170508.1 hypothetical protein KC360_g6771 [Hortaea werneckii]RMY87321.1 hypothetical protein D0861_05434 [Hortaea werneckii]